MVENIKAAEETKEVVSRNFIEQEIENNKDCPALVGFIKKAYLR